MRHVAIIGGGFGGLGLAIRLQAKGFAVTLYEQHDVPGGRAGRILKNGYRFDTGPSLITAIDEVRSLFEIGGDTLENYVRMTRLQPFYRIYFGGSDPLGLWGRSICDARRDSPSFSTGCPAVSGVYESD